jgi:hypothetical protein
VKHIAPVVCCLLLLYAFLPSVPLLAPAGPVAAALSTAPRTDRSFIGRIYRALGDVTKRGYAEQRITTVSAWRNVHRSALGLAADSSNVKGKYPGLDVAVEGVLAKHFALDDVALTPELVEKIVAGCTDVEKQCGL